MYFRTRYKTISRERSLSFERERLTHNSNDNVILIEIDKIPDTLKHKKIYKMLKENCKKNYITNQIIPFPLDLYKKELVFSSS